MLYEVITEAVTLAAALVGTDQVDGRPGAETEHLDTIGDGQLDLVDVFLQEVDAVIVID